MDSSLNILVVEDHDELREATVAALAGMGHNVRGAECGEAVDEITGRFRPDLLVLDLNLPGEDGISIARRMRAAEPGIGIIMVTARHQPRDKVSGYDSGADIYLTKPISADELGAAVMALARRIRPTTVEAGQLSLNPKTLQLCGPAGCIDVSDQESALLAAFCKAAGHRLETWQILEMLGKEMDEHGKSALEVQIVRLRKKLETAGAPSPTVKSIRGVGYQLCIAVIVMSGL